MKVINFKITDKETGETLEGVNIYRRFYVETMFRDESSMSYKEFPSINSTKIKEFLEDNFDEKIYDEKKLVVEFTI